MKHQHTNSVSVSHAAWACDLTLWDNTALHLTWSSEWTAACIRGPNCSCRLRTSPGCSTSCGECTVQLVSRRVPAMPRAIERLTSGCAWHCQTWAGSAPARASPDLRCGSRWPKGNLSVTSTCSSSLRRSGAASTPPPEDRKVRPESGSVYMIREFTATRDRSWATEETQLKTF